MAIASVVIRDGSMARAGVGRVMLLLLPAWSLHLLLSGMALKEGQGG